MKKLGMFLMLLLALTIQSHHVFAQSVTITLMPGWNWISVPLMDTLDFETALGSFTPMQGDIIKSQWSNAIYSSNGQWRGPISQFYPGYGYMYKSNRPMPVTVTFNVQQPAPQVIVTTAEPTDITTNSATCGGNVASSNGDYVSVTNRGICWSTNPNPTFNDNYVEAGNGIGSFAASMTDLTIGTTYYVRAFAIISNGTFYGEQKTFITRDGIPTLTTADITDITGISATCGGNITDDGGLSVMSRGVCWSTTPNPTISDNHTTDGIGTGNFSSIIIGLNWGTTYYVRAYATTDAGIVFGNEISFTTLDDWVDLGLPSNTLWATCNAGACTPEGYGNYFAWGETNTKSTYELSTYQHCTYDYNSYYYKLTKYCNKSNCGYYGFTDNLTILELCDDAATANWGNGWRIPTQEEWQELLQNTTCTWTVQNGVYGQLFTASNGNSLFIPAAGCRTGSNFNNVGSSGNYWSSSLDDYPYVAKGFNFSSDDYDLNGSERYYGCSVRAVRSVPQK